MSGYYDSNDPLRRDSPYDLNAGRDGGAWVWIAGAALVVILVALAFGAHQGNQAGTAQGNQAGTNVAQNNSPGMSRSASPPASPAGPAYKPAPMSPTPTAPANKP